MMDPLPYLQEISFKDERSRALTHYPFSIPAVKHLQTLTFAKNVTFIVGENGSGKSTLLEAIAIGLGFNPEGGTKNFNFNTRNTHSDLSQHLRFAKSYKKHKDGFFLRAESFYNVATNIDEMDEEIGGPPLIDSYGGTSLHAQSHGESFLSLMLHRFFGSGLYILDEPEAALSPNRLLVMLSRMHQLVLQESQFIIATHSPILMAYPGAKIIELSETGFNEVAYEDTDHFQLTKHFLNNHEGMLKTLLQ